MAQISIIKKSDILEAHRFDAEYFKPEYLKLEKNIKNNAYFNFENCIKVLTDGKHGGVTFTSSGVLFIRNNNIINGVLDINDKKYISIDESEESKRAEISSGDILLTTIGTIGESVVVPDEIERANINQNLVKIRLKKNYSSVFISNFLNSKYGKFQTERFSTGNVQPLLNYPRIKKILIPNLSISFQLQIEKIVKEAHQKQTKSKQLYIESEQLLLEKLDLLDFQPKHTLSFKTTKKEVSKAKRFDSEYFQPKYKDIIERIENYDGGFDILEKFIKNYSTGYPFKSSTYVKNGCHLIRINNIEKGRLNLKNANKIPYENINLSKKDIAKENDILISMSGTIGNSCRVPKGTIAVINQRIFRFTPQNFEEEVLTLLINSIIGLSQLQRIGTGGVQTNISSNDIKEIKIPLIKPQIQKEIAEKIKESHQLRKESKELLELAKHKVEQEIEHI